MIKRWIILNAENLINNIKMKCVIQTVWNESDNHRAILCQFGVVCLWFVVVTEAKHISQ